MNAKTFLLFFFILILAAAVGASGCLGNDGDNTAENTTAQNNSKSTSSESNGQTIPVFNANMTLVDSVPSDLTFLSTTTVKSHGQHIGLTDALFGYQGIYLYGDNNTSVYLTYYDVSIATTSKTSADYVQNMIDSHQKQYGSDSKVSTVKFNGHDAVLLTAETAEAPQYGRCILTWSLGDDMFVTVTGGVDSSILVELATATGY